MAKEVKLNHDTDDQHQHDDEPTGIPGIPVTEQEKQTKSTSKKTYEQLIMEAIAENGPRRKGVSFRAIKSFIKGKYNIEVNGYYIKKAFEKLAAKEIVEHSSGTGITGSIRFTKAHLDNEKKQQKIANKASKPVKDQAKSKNGEKKKTAKAGKANQKKDKKDKNNNDSQKKKEKMEKTVKSKSAPKMKLNLKKTAITKTKIDRSGGKVRLSIVADPGPSSSKAKAIVAKTKVQKKEAATKAHSTKRGKKE
uniref:H15 domain-containing protein n=1 Tax=Anopheles epiroticus TaxID=199890 RepID=A0A182P487_9DIPT